MSIQLYAIADRYTQAFYALADSDFDDETIDGTLESIEGEIVEKGKNIAAFWLNLGAEIEAIKLAESRIAARRKTLENKQARLKEYLKENMARCGITEIRSDDGTFKAKLYLGRDESVVIDDESAIPMDYKREIPVSYQVDKTLAKKAIHDGYEIPGLHIERKDRIEIK